MENNNNNNQSSDHSSVEYIFKTTSNEKISIRSVVGTKNLDVEVHNLITSQTFANCFDNSAWNIQLVHAEIAEKRITVVSSDVSRN